jgi:EAL domain-containing protein (putative c-di-GMP-specific phosphodiesterase class I)
MDKVMEALSDCIASDAASLHRGGDVESEGLTSLMSHAPVLLRNIERSLFKPVFQPVYDLQRDGIGFLEALIRLDKDGVPVSPERYLDTVFRLGLDRFLSEFILAEALDMAVRSGHTVSFNATFRDIMLPCFRENLADAYRAMEGRPNTLIVEITEQAAVDDPSALIEFVSDVHARGGLVFLDDFGSGYSNYASLLASRFDAVKAAGEIVREIAVRPEAYTLYRGMTAFCAEAGLSVVAEHISDESIQKAAMAGGARYLQGYLFSPPVSAQAVLQDEFKFPAGFSPARAPLESAKPRQS